MLLHVLVPFRAHFLSDNPEWTEEGKNYSWRMMLSHKDTFVGFLVVDLANDVSVDYMAAESEPIALQHLAFLVSEEEFDGALARIRERTRQIWADPAKKQPGRINRHFGGRGVYFDDPNGHLFEIITTPYGDPASL